MAPFVQRHWKKAFFWVAVAGIGYLTIPEIYYERFLGYVDIDDPDYEGCIHLLSLAAFEEEEEIVRVRRPMPTNAAYRYSASVAPEPAVSSGPSCALEPFIERSWSRPFVWVQIPKVGNVTVPEEYYDRFYEFCRGASQLPGRLYGAGRGSCRRHGRHHQLRFPATRVPLRGAEI